MKTYVDVKKSEVQVWDSEQHNWRAATPKELPRALELAVIELYRKLAKLSD